MEDRPRFLRQLHREIQSHETKADKQGMRPAIRLNDTSDLPWERIDPTLFTAHPGVQFYDYTKDPGRYQAWLDRRMPANYHLTFSRDEENDWAAVGFLWVGGNVAVVFKQPLPESWCGCRVIDGDQNDLRFLDPTGVVVGLKAKRRAMTDESGFLIRNPLEGMHSWIEENYYHD